MIYDVKLIPPISIVNTKYKYVVVIIMGGARFVVIWLLWRKVISINMFYFFQYVDK